MYEEIYKTQMEVIKNSKEVEKQIMFMHWGTQYCKYQSFPI